jgi:hypothetical protein
MVSELSAILGQIIYIPIVALIIMFGARKLEFQDRSFLAALKAAAVILFFNLVAGILFMVVLPFDTTVYFGISFFLFIAIWIPVIKNFYKVTLKDSFFLLIFYVIVMIILLVLGGIIFVLLQ